jgi:hypothetical protein
MAERRRVAVRTAMSLYEGSPSRRAKILERQYRAYLASAWRLERDLESLPHPRSTERVLLHRLARLNEGASLCWRRIFDVARSCCASRNIPISLILGCRPRGFRWPATAADFRRRRRPFLGRGSSAPFGSAPETWAALQLDYDMAQAMKHADRIKVRKVPLTPRI